MDIVGLHEVAERTGYGYGTVANWNSSGKLPTPDWSLACGPIWDWDRLRATLIAAGKIDAEGRPLQLRPPTVRERMMKDAEQAQRQGRAV